MHIFFICNNTKKTFFLIVQYSRSSPIGENSVKKSLETEKNREKIKEGYVKKINMSIFRISFFRNNMRYKRQDF